MQQLLLSEIYLAELGFYPQQSGFGYLAFAIALVAADPAEFYAGRLNIMALIHEKYNVSVLSARRCMNYSIHSAWNAAENSALRSIFHEDRKDYPPAMYEFICRAAIEMNRGRIACGQ